MLLKLSSTVAFLAAAVYYFKEYLPFNTQDQIMMYERKAEFYYKEMMKPFKRPNPTESKTKMFTKEELSKYTGESDSPGLYIALLGDVFDVSGGNGPEYYGPEGGYRGFAGRDGSKAFITGMFNETGLIEDCSDLSPAQSKDLNGWVDFYRDHEEYFQVGRLIGFYFDENGDPTQGRNEFFAKVDKADLLKKQQQEKNEKVGKLNPGCNTRWTQKEGGSVWCSKDSGGAKRDWVGVPRLWHHWDALQERNLQTCVCVPEDKVGEKDPEEYVLYAGCDPKAFRCQSSPPRD